MGSISSFSAFSFVSSFSSVSFMLISPFLVACLLSDSSLGCVSERSSAVSSSSGGFRLDRDRRCSNRNALESKVRKEKEGTARKQTSRDVFFFILLSVLVPILFLFFRFKDEPFEHKEKPSLIGKVFAKKKKERTMQVSISGSILIQDLQVEEYGDSID